MSFPLEPRIAIFATTLDERDGGISRSIPYLAGAVHAAGGDVVLIYPDFGNSLAIDPKTLKYPSICLKMSRWMHNPIYNSIGLSSVLRELRDKNYTVFHHGGMWTAMNHQISQFAKKNRIHLVCSPRGMLDPWAISYKSWKKKICWIGYARRDLKSADLLHATANLEAGYLRKLGFRQSIAMIPNGVYLPSLTDLEEKKSGANQKTLLFMSRVHPKKGLDLLVKAWAEVKPCNWRVLIAGPDEAGHTAEIKRLALKYGVNKDFDFIGNICEQSKWTYLRRADVFVLPTYAENFGIVVAEALACETPVITTEGAPWDFLDVEGCGWSVPVSVEGVSIALRKMVDMPSEQLTEMGRRGRKLVESKFSWDKIGEQMLLTYREISRNR